MKFIYSLFISFSLISCAPKDQPSNTMSRNYSYDAQFLREHTQQVIELEAVDGKAKVLLSAEYQSRVMTSTSGGDKGISYGWLNYDLISSGKKAKQFNPVGGEERFWLGPEGGQYSLYFAPQASFTIDNWQVPALLDTLPFEVVETKPTYARFSKKASIANYRGTTFDLLIDRKISLLSKSEIETDLDLVLAKSLNVVAYRTENQLQNIGTTDWQKENGLLSIWLLGMFTPSDHTAVIIPFNPIPNAKELITTNYFGEIPTDRLTLKDSVLFFTCDGKYRSKIGLPPSLAKPIAASFDFEKNILTLIIFDVNPKADYVNAKWEIQTNPFKGDAVNSYNDGPLENGNQLGPFYELESSSPALALKAGEWGKYTQTTFHAEGDFVALNEISKKLLGIDLMKLKP